MSRSVLRLAWRNLWRHRRRTQLLLTVVAYATVAIILFWGFYDGFVAALLDSQARTLSAPVLVTSEAWQADHDPENALPELSFADTLAAQEGVRAVAPRLELAGLLRSPYETLGARLRGIDPDREALVSDLPAAVRDGRMLAEPNELVLGRGLAEKLDVRLGERLVVDVQSTAGLQSVGLSVVGFIDSGMTPVDDTTVLLHLNAARALTGVGTATGLVLDVPQGREAAVAQALNASGVLPAGVRAYAVGELLGGLLRGIESKRAGMVPLVVIFAVFAAITVMSTVIVSVLERTREFGVVTSLGLDQNQLGWMVTFEAVFTTALGFAVGVVLGLALSWALSTWNLLGPVIQAVYGGILGDFAISDELYLPFTLAYLGWASITIVIAAVFALLAPARRLRRLEPATALRAR